MNKEKQVMCLKGKKVILIVPRFYGYDQYIKESLVRKGASVHVVYENLDELNYFYMFIYIYFTFLKDKLINCYYKNKLSKVIYDADYVIVIRGSSCVKDVMEYMRRNAKSSCKFYMYQWDGVDNNPIAKDVADYFDKVSTFDPRDADLYGWEYQPLFFIDELVKYRAKDTDFLYIGSLHSNRIKILNSLKRITQTKGLVLKVFVFSKRAIFYIRKYIYKRNEYVKAENCDIIFKPLSIKESYELYSNAKIVVDYTHPNQKGFTMRTIECLGNRCKLVTNNINVKTADFYHPNNIYIYDEKNFEIPDDFISKEYTEINSTIYKSYSIHSWIGSMMSSEGKK